MINISVRTVLKAHFPQGTAVGEIELFMQMNASGVAAGNDGDHHVKFGTLAGGLQDRLH